MDSDIFMDVEPKGSGDKSKDVKTKDVLDWTKDDVVAWALTVDDVTQEDANLLKKQRITGRSLLEMTDEKLERCGIPVGPTTNLIEAIKALHPEKTQPEAPAQDLDQFGTAILEKPSFVENFRDAKDWPFLNREDQIEQFLRLSLENLLVPNAGKSSQKKLVLLVAAQEMGSGKSYFGQNVLSKAQQLMQTDIGFCGRIQSQFMPADIDRLLRAVVIHIDFRYFPQGCGTFENALRREVLRNLIYFCPSISQSQREAWVSFRRSDWDLPSILKWFNNKLDGSIFIHFDEIDCIRYQNFEECRQLETALDFFYYFWSLIHPILATRNFLYCSGRSPVLYALGKNLYNHPEASKKSPGLTEIISFPGLSCSHINELLTYQHLPQIGTQIHGLTSGVPRLVVYTIEFYKKERTLDISQLMTYLKENANNEVFKYSTLHTQQLRRPYLELFKFSLLQIDIQDDFVVDPQEWNITPTYFPRAKRIPFLEVAWIFGAYTQPSPRSKFLRVVFPRVVVEGFVEQMDKLDTSVVPIYHAAKLQSGALFKNPSEAFEELTRLCLISRFTQQKLLPLPDTLQSAFPSFVRNHPQALRLTGCYCFPQIVNRDVYFDKGRVQKWVDSPYTPPIVNDYPQVSSSGWDKLWECLTPGRLYVPAPKSSSGDLMLFYVGTSPTMISIQIKSGSAFNSLKVLVDEATKIFQPVLIRENVRMTMVMVAPELPDLSSLPLQEDDFIYYLSPKTRIGQYQIPDFCEIVILKRPALLHLFTQYNLNLIQ